MRQHPKRNASRPRLHSGIQPILQGTPAIEQPEGLTRLLTCLFAEKPKVAVAPGPSVPPLNVPPLTSAFHAPVMRTPALAG